LTYVNCTDILEILVKVKYLREFCESAGVWNHVMLVLRSSTFSVENIDGPVYELVHQRFF
jgi:hypothetical protein